ncbi:MAG TPA: protein arginine kinase, partial [Parachlamydiaceae bacterium]|nr:protein arginine kinase [Parachlamydiaceae bacterium]
MPNSENHNPILFPKKPWSNNANPIWLASTISLHRNIEKFKFPGKLSTDRKKQIISLVSKELLSDDLKNSNHLINPSLIKAEEIGLLEKEFLVEHFLSNHNYNQAHSGEGFILDESGTFLATINMRDHIYLQLIDCQGELENTWSRLVKIETALGKNLNYSFQSKFGFLTADPTQCGTALSVTAYLQIPGLIHTNKIEKILNSSQDESIAISGIQGNPNEIIGDILMIQNDYTLGLTEENIISTLRSFTAKMIAEEVSARHQIKRDDSPELKDKVSRAFGILIHSYQIEAIEALNALSLLKLGIEAGWVAGIGLKEVNELFFS